MKCPECGAKQKRKYGMSCGACKYRFVLDPKADGITDGKFVGAVRAVSRNDTTYFTFNQLYAQYLRRKDPMSRRGGWRILIIMGAIAVCVVAMFPPFLACALPFAGLITILLIVKNLAAPTPIRKVRAWVQKWQEAGRPLEKFIDKPGLHQPPPEWSEPDIYDYGVERVLIVEHDLFVDLFVRNGLHAEQRALIVAENGYPAYIFRRAAELLKSQPELPVFLLHDSTPHGIEMRERLRASRKLPLQDHPIVDCGLFPDDVRRIKRVGVTKPKKQGFEVPLDLLPYGMIAAGLGTAFVHDVAFGTMLSGRFHGSTVGDFG